MLDLHALARGWAAMCLPKNPWHRRRRSGKEEWEQRAVEQGAINSVLRVTAVESGLLSFDHVVPALHADQQRQRFSVSETKMTR